MDVLSSRVLLRPTDPERSRVFYRDTLGLAIYREFGSGPDRGTVFFGSSHRSVGAVRL
jgi:catechol 2,3-dioxygenase-like lactoylglutathione lyase family enzyme